MTMILTLYVLFGAMMGAAISETPLAKWGILEVLTIIGLHIPFLAGGALLARSSTPVEGGGYRRKLSPGAWRFALVASYVIGFVAFLLANK